MRQEFSSIVMEMQQLSQAEHSELKDLGLDDVLGLSK